mmetsp:Transcript_12044/g.33006  ORF Transcript_12044/g.33006 Transcript_12044/m.33006 type:complete len:361 (+) Transcript_12044:367-1449(+)
MTQYLGFLRFGSSSRDGKSLPVGGGEGAAAAAAVPVPAALAPAAPPAAAFAAAATAAALAAPAAPAAATMEGTVEASAVAPAEEEEAAPDLVAPVATAVLSLPCCCRTGRKESQELCERNRAALGVRQVPAPAAVPGLLVLAASPAGRKQETAEAGPTGAAPLAGPAAAGVLLLAAELLPLPPPRKRQCLGNSPALITGTPAFAALPTAEAAALAFASFALVAGAFCPSAGGTPVTGRAAKALKLAAPPPQSPAPSNSLSSRESGSGSSCNGAGAAREGLRKSSGSVGGAAEGEATASDGRSSSVALPAAVLALPRVRRVAAREGGRSSRSSSSKEPPSLSSSESSGTTTARGCAQAQAV